MCHTARNVTADTNCCSVLGVAAEVVISETGNPHLVAISWSWAFVNLPSSRMFCTCCMWLSMAVRLSAGRFFLMLVVHVLREVMLAGGS